ncbi:SGNH/GDSL hydrolase family protein [Paenibacillus sp. GCM10027626]|uniref:SGNH/GDSL hydrolase family protein n=1 Tax=Paenibacillus sp. GCM10027626 TaxID=3273411 RepID=UPI00363EC8EB
MGGKYRFRHLVYYGTMQQILLQIIGKRCCAINEIRAGRKYDGPEVRIRWRLTAAAMLVLIFILAAAVMLYLKVSGERMNDSYVEITDPIERALVPFWDGKTMYDETLLMVADGEGRPAAKLLFKPDRIVSVTNSVQDIRYEEGVDWIYEDGLLQVPEGSRIAVLKKSQLYPATHLPGMDFPRKGGGNVLYREGSFFHENQINVTYTHDTSQWQGSVPKFAGQTLPRTIGKLRAGQPLRLVLFGDSIAEGQNTSGKIGAAPYLPTWGELLANKLRKAYCSDIDFSNLSVGGKDSAWGKAEAAKRVAAHRLDLVIIAFGMNDGTLDVSPEVFRENIRDIMDTVRHTNPESEFILVSPSLPNPETDFYKRQADYKPALDSLALKGIAVADMTGIHQELLLHKSFVDMTGNNINHPNDFLIRWYAQYLIGMLVS